MKISKRKSNPYIEKKIDKNSYIRIFSKNTNDIDLAWHRDKENRTIEIISGKDWKFQYDNYLPVNIEPGYKILINKNEWHRIIKGSTDLIIIVHK